MRHVEILEHGSGCSRLWLIGQVYCLLKPEIICDFSICGLLPSPIPRRRQPFVSVAGTERADAGRADRCIDVGGDYAITSFEVLYEQGRSASDFGLGAHLLARQGSLLGRDWDAEIGP